MNYIIATNFNILFPTISKRARAIAFDLYLLVGPQKNYCQGSIKGLAKKLNTSRRTLRRALIELENVSAIKSYGPSGKKLYLLEYVVSNFQPPKKSGEGEFSQPKNGSENNKNGGGQKASKWGGQGGQNKVNWGGLKVGKMTNAGGVRTKVPTPTPYSINKNLDQKDLSQSDIVQGRFDVVRRRNAGDELFSGLGSRGVDLFRKGMSKINWPHLVAEKKTLALKNVPNLSIDLKKSSCPALSKEAIKDLLSGNPGSSASELCDTDSVLSLFNDLLEIGMYEPLAIHLIANNDLLFLENCLKTAKYIKQRSTKHIKTLPGVVKWLANGKSWEIQTEDEHGNPVREVVVGSLITPENDDSLRKNPPAKKKKRKLNAWREKEDVTQWNSHDLSYYFTDKTIKKFPEAHVPTPRIKEFTHMKEMQNEGLTPFDIKKAIDWLVENWESFCTMFRIKGTPRIGLFYAMQGEIVDLSRGVFVDKSKDEYKSSLFRVREASKDFVKSDDESWFG